MTTATTQSKPQDAPDVHSQPQDVEKRIRIRSYEPRDHQQVLDIFVPGLLSYAEIPGQSRKFWEDYVAYSLTNDLADIHGTYFAPGGHYWVAVVDREDGSEQEVVGMVALQPKDNGDGELRRMSVKAECRRYGVGRMLVKNLEDWAAQHGFTRVWLAAGYAMKRAHQFYESLGYRNFGDKVLCEDPLFVEGCFEKHIGQAAAAAEAELDA